MKGIPLHPLRLAALDRMTVLRVPMTNLGGVKLVERAAPADWNAGRAHPNMRRFEDWKDKDSGALFFIETGSVVFVPAPYAPGDYFVKETWQICPPDKMLPGEVGYPWHGNSALRTVFKADVKFDTHPDHPEWGKQRWRPSIHLDEHDARYIVTLGPPVPCRLGEVDVVQQRDEGVIIEIGDEYRRTWDALYPKHPYSPDLWTWGYPMEVRLKLNEKEEMP
jgi:hypothetical protein